MVASTTYSRRVQSTAIVTRPGVAPKNSRLRQSSCLRRSFPNNLKDTELALRLASQLRMGARVREEDVKQLCRQFQDVIFDQSTYLPTPIELEKHPAEQTGFPGIYIVGQNDFVGAPRTLLVCGQINDWESQLCKAKLLSKQLAQPILLGAHCTTGSLLGDSARTLALIFGEETPLKRALSYLLQSSDAPTTVIGHSSGGVALQASGRGLGILPETQLLTLGTPWFEDETGFGKALHVVHEGDPIPYILRGGSLGQKSNVDIMVVPQGFTNPHDLVAYIETISNQNQQCAEEGSGKLCFLGQSTALRGTPSSVGPRAPRHPSAPGYPVIPRPPAVRDPPATPGYPVIFHRDSGLL